MAKLNQVIAAEKGVKGRAESALTEAYKLIQKGDLFTGLARKYDPLDDKGEQRPSENKKLQNRAPELLKQVQKQLVELFDTVATKEKTNTKAKADVKVDGKVLLADVPVATLLFLEKKLVDLRTFVSKLPELDPAETWAWEENQNCYATYPIKKASTKKVQAPLVLAPATEKHPAQVQLVSEDVVVGYWTETKYSGALPSTRITELLERVEKLQMAVKYAREEANGIQVEEMKVGETVLGYIFAP